MFLNYFKKIMVYVIILLFIMSFFIPCVYSFVEFEKYSFIENDKTNNIPHKLNIELIINKEAYFKDYNTNNNAQVTLSIMCEWVIGYKNHGPAKTEFLVNTPCWSYNEFIDLHDGDNVSMVWYRNGEIYRSISTGPLEWGGTGSITSGFPSILHTGSWYVKVYCNGVYLITGPNFVVIDNKSPNTPSNPNPANNAKDIDINTNLSWTGGDPDLGDNVTYDVYFGVLLPLQKVATNISISFYDPGILAVNLTYFWKIVAWDNHGASTIGPLWDFTTTEELNNPPNKPSKPEGFGVGRVGRSYSYSSVAFDPNDDDIYYWFDWGDGTNSGWDGPHNSGDSVSISHIWVNGGSYPIKVKVKDIFDAESVWSDSLVINMPKSKSIYIRQYLFNFLSKASIIKDSIIHDTEYKNTNKQIYLGYAKITGNGNTSILEAVAENNLVVGIDDKTSYVDFYINYTMNCSGDTDNGQIWLTVAINGQNITPALATTFNVDEGVLKIPGIQVNRRDGFQFIIKVIYANVIPFYTNDTQAIGGGVISKSIKYKTGSYNPFYQIIENLVSRFPFFEKILNQ